VAGEQQFDDLATGRLVEITGRLIGNQNRRMRRERTCQRDALLLAARQLRRIVIDTLAQSDRGQFLRGALEGIAGAREFERHRDVLQRRHGGDQVERLEHDADMPSAKARERVLVERAQVLPRDVDRPGVGPLQSGRDHQQGRFARAGRANQANRLAGTYMKADVFENMDPRSVPAEREIDAGECNRRRTRRNGGVVHEDLALPRR